VVVAVNGLVVEGDATHILGARATYYLPMVTQQGTSNSQKVIDDARLRPKVESAHRPIDSERTHCPPRPATIGFQRQIRTPFTAAYVRRNRHVAAGLPHHRKVRQ
jgi:hypothetical protein